jgi:hypothetical protein
MPFHLTTSARKPVCIPFYCTYIRSHCLAHFPFPNHLDSIQTTSILSSFFTYLFYRKLTESRIYD